LKALPKTSIIIVFHNEYYSVLKRLFHSIFNRTPDELLLEVIVINDGSTKEELHEPLKKYLADNFDDRIKYHLLPEKTGEIVARMTGVRMAKGEVFVLLDSHIEVNVNWLPPLLGK